MKLEELYEDEALHGKQWSDEDLEKVYKEVSTSAVSKEEAQELARTLKEKYKFERTETGIYQILMQLHMIVHGEFPSGVIVYPGNWQKVTKKIMKFGQEKGHNVEEQIDHAKKDMESRIAKKKAKKNKPEALQLRSDYYKEHKDKLPKDIKSHADDIVKDIMNGLSAEEAFGRWK